MGKKGIKTRNEKENGIAIEREMKKKEKKENKNKRNNKKKSKE